MAMVSAASAGGLRGEFQLDLPISPSGQYNSDEPDIAASGYHLYATWTETAVSPATTNEVYFCRSEDGGRSWSSPVLISSAASIDDASPDVQADGDLVAVVWLHGLVTATQDVQGVVSTDGGVSFGPILDLSGYLKGDAGDADSLQVHVHGTNVYVSFADDANSPGGNEDLYVVSSTNSGTSFSAPVRVNDPVAGTADIDDPDLKTVGSTVYLVWVDKRTGNDRVYFDQSVDGGANWGTDKRLDRAGTADCDAPSMSVDGSNVYVVWSDDRNDPAVADQVFFVSSTDSGVSFSLDKKLGSAALGVDADRPRVSVSGTSVYAVWIDDRNGLDDIFFAASSDGGSTFAAEFPLDPDGGTILDEVAYLRSLDDSVFVIYREEATPTLDRVWVSYSADRGASGSFQRLELTATMGPTRDADNHAIAITSARDVVGIWADDRAGGVNNDVYVNGQRFPDLTAVQNGNKTSFRLDDATPSEEGMFFVAAFSSTGTNSFEIAPGMNLCLTVDSFTLLFLGGWAIPLVSDIVQNGSASTVDLPLQKFSGYAAGVIIDPGTHEILATTDPVSFH